MHRLEFDQVHSYASRPGGVSLPILLTSNSGGKVAEVLAYVDTGASNCVFAREHGELLGLDIESGERMLFSTAAGRVETFGHWVTIETLGLSVESLVYFFADEHVKRNLLGRTGWLDRIRFGLVDHDQLLFLSEYSHDAR